MMRVIAVISSALALAIAACGDDGAASAAPDTTTPGDTTAPPDTTAAGDSAGPEVTEVADIGADPDVVVCGSITCNEPPAPECTPDLSARRTYGAVGACEFDDGGWPLCRYPVSDTRCPMGEACRMEGGTPRCGPPRNTCEVALAKTASWVSAARLPSGPDDACCFDYDGDGAVDNGMAELAAAVAPLYDADVQEFVDAFIQRGLNAFLLQYRGLDDATNDNSVDIDVLIGLDPDGVYDNNLLGTQAFKVRGQSYDGPTPRSTFPEATITNGRLSASGDAMSLLMPLTDDLFAAGLRDVRFEATVTPGANGQGLSIGPVGADVHGARLGALFPLSELYRAVNEFASKSCPCLDLGGNDLLSQNADGWQCNDAVSAACSLDDPDESMCASLASYCGAALILLKPDVGDAFSIGIWLEAVSADLDGFVATDGSTLRCE